MSCVRTLLLVVVSCFAASTVRAAEPKEPKPLPKEITNAWAKKIDASVGWMRPSVGPFVRLPHWERCEGDIPALSLYMWKKDVIADLPAPSQPFGLDISADSWGSDEVTDRELKKLARFKELRMLTLAFTSLTDEGMKELTSLTKLEALSIGQSQAYTAQITDVGLKEISKLKQLRFLWLRDQKVTDAGLKEIAKLQHLQNLCLTNTLVTDAGMKELAALVELRELHLPDTAVTGVGLKELAGLKHLRTLTLISTEVTDDGMKSLAALKGLEELDLEGTKITDAGVQHLATLKELRALNLSCEITDAAVKNLAGLTKLRQLNLYGTDITDVGLKQLVGLKDLRDLNLCGTKVTKQGVAEFQKTLPKCDIFCPQFQR